MNRVAPTELKIWAFGRVETSKGTFVFDSASAKSVISEYQRAGNDLCFDYEHKAVDPEARAGDGKAAGWFSLELRKDGLYATGIKWTDRARGELESGEWRYFSPAFQEDPTTKRIMRLTNIALTNIPATHNLTPLVAASLRKNSMEDDQAVATEAPTIDDKKLKLKQLEDEAAELRKALADEESVETTEEDVDADVNIVQPETEIEDDDEDESSDPKVAKQAKLKRLKGIVAQLEQELAEHAEPDGDELPPAKMSLTLSAISKATGVHLSSKGEAVGVMKALGEAGRLLARYKKRLDAIERREHVACVDQAVRAGKLTPGQKSWALSVSRETLGGYLKTSPSVGKKVHVEAPVTLASGDHVTVEGRVLTLTEEDKKAMKVTGLSTEQYAKIKLQTLSKK